MAVAASGHCSQVRPSSRATTFSTARTDFPLVETALQRGHCAVLLRRMCVVNIHPHGGKPHFSLHALMFVFGSSFLVHLTCTCTARPEQTCCAGHECLRCLLAWEMRTCGQDSFLIFDSLARRSKPQVFICFSVSWTSFVFGWNWQRSEQQFGHTGTQNYLVIDSCIAGTVVNPSVRTDTAETRPTVSVCLV